MQSGTAAANPTEPLFDKIYQDLFDLVKYLISCWGLMKVICSMIHGQRKRSADLTPPRAVLQLSRGYLSSKDQ